MGVEAAVLERIMCPACGGAGGGPFGRAGSAWDDEDYVCPRCQGVGVLTGDAAAQVPRPGLAKTTSADAETLAPRRKAAG